MIPTTKLRILRTSLRAYPNILSPTALPVLSSSRRHIPPCLRQHLHASRAAAFSTTSLRLAKYASESSPVPTHEPAPEVESYPPNPAAANPPATTRPPPLDLPTREPEQSTFSFYFATGKAYLKFYKTGLKHIYLNTRLVWSLDTAAPSPATIDPAARAALLLRHRWRYDIRRLPPFALILLVCGEFTPFVVLAFPSLVPYTCRIPRQLAALATKAEARRAASFARLRKARVEAQQQQRCEAAHPLDNNNNNNNNNKARLARAQVTCHIARSLNLISPLWDRLLGIVPDRALAPLLAQRKVRAHLLFLLRDDSLLRRAGGVDALEGKEVVLACLDRAIETVGQDEAALRGKLAQWLGRTPTRPNYAERGWDSECEYLIDYLDGSLDGKS